MTLLKGGCALAALFIATPALAQAPSPEALAELVRAQAEMMAAQSAEIAELRARLDTLEGRQVAAVAAPTAAPSVAQPQGAAAPLVLASAPAAPVQDPGLTTEWGAGLPTFRSSDGRFSFKPRGRILADVSATSGSDYDDRNITTTGMRALRMGVEGAVGSHFFYQFETDFADNQADVVTAFVGWRDRIADGVSYDIRAGHLFNDRSMEGSTGSDSTPFLERSVVATSIIPQRGFYGLGVMPRLFWSSGHASLSITGDRIDGSQSIDDSRTVTARIHYNPLKSEDGALHLGAWGFDEQLASASPGVLTRNTVIGGRFNGALRVSSGALEGGTGTTGYGVELGGYKGPLWLMAEAGHRDASLDAGRPDFVTEAWSLSGGWFLTGEAAPYSAKSGIFSQPKVKRSVFDGGRGALELTARYEHLDFSDISTPADGWAATIGANWYLNDFTRFQVNGVHWRTDNTAGAFIGPDDGQTVSGRVAVTF